MIVSSKYSTFIHGYSDDVIKKIETLDDVYDYVELIKLLIRDLESVLNAKQARNCRPDGFTAISTNLSNVNSILENQATNELKQLQMRKRFNVKIAREYKEMIRLLEVEIKEKQDVLRSYESMLKV